MQIPSIIPARSPVSAGSAVLPSRRRWVPWVLALIWLAGTSLSAATLRVTHLGDSGPGSLRQALRDSRDGDRIEFDVLGTIELSSTLVASNSVTLAGPGADRLVLDGRGRNRILDVKGGGSIDGSADPRWVDVWISGIHFTRGDAVRPDSGWDASEHSGGAIRGQATRLKVTDCHFTQNRASSRGAAVAAYDATFAGCTFAENWSEGVGDSASALMDPALVDRCTFYRNSGGMGTVHVGNTRIKGSTFFDNADAPAINLLRSYPAQLTMENTLVVGTRNGGDLRMAGEGGSPNWFCWVAISSEPPTTTFRAAWVLFGRTGCVWSGTSPRWTSVEPISLA